MRKITLAFALSCVTLFAGKNVVLTNTTLITPNTSLVSHGVSLKLGTLGLGLDAEHYFNKKFALRLNINGLEYEDSKTVEDVPFDYKLTLFTAGLLADYHPYETPFRVTGGLYYNGNKASFSGQTSGTVSFAGFSYNLGDINIDGSLKFNKVAPYLGLGWSSAESNGWHLTSDIGVMYHGTPKFKLNATKKDPTNLLIDQDQLEADTKVKEKEIQDKIKNYKFYPVISIGIEKKF